MGSVGSIRIRQGAQGVVSKIGGVVDVTKLTVQGLVDNTLLFLRDRSTAYRLLFDQRDMKSKIVMNDLLNFSHWGSTKFIENERLAERVKGRQDVINRINEHLSLTPRQLFTLYNNSPVPQDVEDEENSDA